MQVFFLKYKKIPEKQKNLRDVSCAQRAERVQPPLYFVQKKTGETILPPGVTFVHKIITL